MYKKLILSLRDEKAVLENVGGKGASLARLARAGFPVPEGFYLSTAAYWSFVTENALHARILAVLDGLDYEDPLELDRVSSLIRDLFLNADFPVDVATVVVGAYNKLQGEQPAVAVRSSATAEDLPEASFAGQQETYLNISGPTALLDAVRKCWASLWTARAISYRARQGISSERVALAVVVQMLVPAEAAGVMFTANPLNGQRDQMTISASWGLGESVVAGLVTPDNLVLRKESLIITTYDVGKKEVQTKRIKEGVRQIVVPLELQEVPVLTDEQAGQLGLLGRKIEAHYGMPMDIEWALADGHFAILQARPITALPEPQADVPTEWKLPEGAYAAMRNNIVELMADPLSPLFSTLGLKAVNESMSRWMTSFLGDPDILPDDPIILVNEYAYYNGSLKMGKILKVIFGAKGILDRMFTGAVARWTDSARPAYKAIIDRWSKSDWHLLTNRELLECVRELTTAAVDGYLALVSGVIPAAWMSEGWFALRYRFWKRKIDPWAAAFLMGFDNLPIRAEKNLFDLAQWVLQDEVLTVDILQSSTPVLKDCINLKENIGEAASENWDEFHSRFNAHLDMYGHMIYDLDFANPVPADDCTPVLETFKLFLKGEGTNPHQRQMKAVLAREKAVEALDSRLKGRRLRAFRETLIRAQKYAPLREDGLADVGLSYPLLRQMLFELGERFVNAGVLEDQKDIFWLRGEEVEAAAEALDLGNGSAVLTSVIPERKATWEAAGHAVPPMILPQLKVFGFDLMSLKSGVRKNKGQLKGVGASPGLTTARACVVHGPEDFAQMKTGDVLVAPLTTPAWTPLFARAAAVVTDIGGPLSHGSIVAREYGIPAVLGTGAATKTIATGQRISVDGTAGLVTIANGKPD